MVIIVIAKQNYFDKCMLVVIYNFDIILLDPWDWGRDIPDFKWWEGTIYNKLKLKIIPRALGKPQWIPCSRIDQFGYINIQPKTIDLSTRLWEINTEFMGFIPREPHSEVY